MSTEPDFTIPSRPTTRYPPQGGVEYVGETIFYLRPVPGVGDDDLDALVTDVLADERYVYGDWFELPLPVYLVHDRTARTVFRVVVRKGRVEFHVLPNTESVGLRSLYDELDAASDRAWSIDCRTSEE